jgi:hypothetical protein
MVEGFGGFSHRRINGGLLIPADGMAPKLPLACLVSEPIRLIIADLRKVVFHEVAETEQGGPHFVDISGISGILIDARPRSQGLQDFFSIQRESFVLERVHNLLASHLIDGFVHVDELRREALSQKAFRDVPSGV